MYTLFGYWNIKSTAFAFFWYCQIFSAVPFHYFFANRKTNTCADVLTVVVQALEFQIHPFLKSGIKTYPIVFGITSHASYLLKAVCNRAKWNNTVPVFVVFCIKHIIFNIELWLPFFLYQFAWTKVFHYRKNFLLIDDHEIVRSGIKTGLSKMFKPC